MRRLRTSLAGVCLTISLFTPLYGVASWFSSDQVIDKTIVQGKKINLNQASLAELLSVQGLGKVRAAAIIAYRERFGGFKQVSDLKKVSGIGSKLFKNIAGLLSVETKG